jgi:hypothetical protein
MILGLALIYFDVMGAKTLIYNFIEVCSGQDGAQSNFISTRFKQIYCYLIKRSRCEISSVQLRGRVNSLPIIAHQKCFVDFVLDSERCGRNFSKKDIPFLFVKRGAIKFSFCRLQKFNQGDKTQHALISEILVYWN